MVIDRLDQLSLFESKSVFLYPVYGDARVHPYATTILAFVLVDISTKQTYSISVNHPEGIWHLQDKSLQFLNRSTVYSYDTREIKYCGYNTENFIDAELQYYLFCNQAYNFENPPLVQHYNRVYNNCNAIGSLIGLLKHEEIAFDLFQKAFVKDIQPGLQFYQNELFYAFHNIEKNGLQIQPELFSSRFGQTNARIGNKCFTKYNFFTTTGRPSNRFGGINFAALNKDDQTRQCFVSRFGDRGKLIEVDFNAYHPRLIASLIGYDFGDKNVYADLAAHYFNKASPSESEIKMMKEATFRQIYGGVQQQYLNIPFFFAAAELSAELWRVFEKDGYIEAPISKRRLKKENYTDIDRWVLFNYFIQMYETESNVVMLNKLHSKMVGMQSVPVLYTYDSILFDVLIEEQQQLLDAVLPSCIDYSKFPVKIKGGSEYKNLEVCV